MFPGRSSRTGAERGRVPMGAPGGEGRRPSTSNGIGALADSGRAAGQSNGGTDRSYGTQSPVCLAVDGRVGDGVAVERGGVIACLW